MQVEEVFERLPEPFERYMVSNYGVVLSQHGRELKQFRNPKNPNSKLRVKLYSAGVAYDFYVHRLVAQGFFIDYDFLCDVHHLSDNYLDNSVTNLHLVDPNG